jgi:assimilatory nitrate reductase catalytic subunit
VPEAWVEVHPDDAGGRGLASGDWATVESARGAIEAIRVRVTTIVRPGEVFVPFHWSDRCANWLTVGEFDPISREPNYKHCAVEVRRTQAISPAAGRRRAGAG